MTRDVKSFFKKFIDCGLQHCSISKETISFRKDLIRKKIDLIFNRLPVELRSEETIEKLSTDLAEISVLVQGFGIRTFGVLPNESLRAKETRQITHQNNYHFDWNNLNEYVTRLGDYISVCKNKLGRLIKNDSSTPIQLRIDGAELAVPDEIQTALIETVTRLLEEAKTRNSESLSKNKQKAINIFFNVVAHKIARFVQTEYLKYPAYYGNPSQTELLIISFTLMAAGYILTPEEYELKKKVKDYRKVWDKEHLEATGKKKQTTYIRYYSHNDVLVMATKGTMRAKGRFNARLVNWLWS